MSEGKHPGGRPTTCTDAFLEKARDYLENYKSTYQDEFPSIAGLAVESGCSRTMLQDWARQDTECPNKVQFQDIYNTLMAKQERVIFKGGINGTFNATICKLGLTKHGYSDKQELGGPDGGAIKVDNKYTVEFVTKKD